MNLAVPLVGKGAALRIADSKRDTPMATVLLVEDHRMNRKLFTDILEIEFDVVAAH